MESQDEFENPELQAEIYKRQKELEFEERKNSELKNDFQEILRHLEGLKRNCELKEELDNIDLFIRLAELQSEYRNKIESHKYLVEKLQRKKPITEILVNKDPYADQLKSRLENCINENQILCQKIQDKGRRIRKSLVHKDLH